MEDRDSQNKGWLGTLLESIVNAYTKLLEGVKKHGFKWAILSLLIILMLYCFIISPVHIGDMIEHKFYQQKEMVDEATEESIIRREKANYFVSELMLNVMERYKGVNRVLLLEKHNGQSNLKGVDFLYSSCTYELVSDSIQHPQYLFEDLQKQTNINLLGSNSIQTLKHKDFLYFDNLEKQSNNHLRLLRKLKHVGDSEAIIFSFKDSKHRPIIMLVISGENLDVRNISEYITSYKKQIEELLID